MKKIAIYFALMEEEKKLQNLFLVVNVFIFLTAILLIILNLVLSIPKILFVFLGFITLFLMFLQSSFILNICRRYANTEFKKLFLKYLEAGTYYQTEKECQKFRKIKRNILIAFVRNNTKSIRNGFAYLKEWQDENVIMYEF